MDSCVIAYSPRRRVRVVVVQTTQTACELANRHLAGPAAAAVLAEGLSGVALLASDLSQDGARVSLRIQSDGPVGGLLVEAAADGSLRGYTNRKVLNDLDVEDPVRLNAALGGQGTAQVVSATSTAVLNRAVVRADAPCVQTAVARYFNTSVQKPTGVAFHTTAGSDGVHCARAALVERLADGTSEHFVPLLERLMEGGETWLARDKPADSAAAFFGLDDLDVTEKRPLQFACGCSRERATNTLRALDREELEAMAAEGKGTTIYCHMCGKGFAIPLETIRELIRGIT
jgi:molecular chaperone Hsp33